MAEDAPAKPSSSTATPGTATPQNPAMKRVKTGAGGLHPSASTDSLAAAGRKAEATKTYLGGSRALEHLAKLITSCEAFFHPSNHGAWTRVLAAFIQDLAWLFLSRWKQEELANCKTPIEWRLTPQIRQQFVLCLRPVALMSIFAKDHTSMASARACLHCMAILEPELIVPPVFERAIPSLTNLEETARTNAVIKAVGAMAWTITTRSNSRSGQKQIPTLLELILPGIDMNDPGKTVRHVCCGNGACQADTEKFLRTDVDGNAADEYDPTHSLGGTSRRSSRGYDSRTQSTGATLGLCCRYCRRNGRPTVSIARRRRHVLQASYQRVFCVDLGIATADLQTL